ncbi:hypothetical protein [Candidatus Tisiphia endosymbiont of Metellina segmentata]|uniref:hypothetical protein n=1 Tax=Candidatus Tisiphia endosymbiont of Metellina segmentata TaxID=3066274 RepID=UPI00313DB71C
MAKLNQIVKEESPLFSEQQINELLQKKIPGCNEADLNLEHYFKSISCDIQQDIPIDHIECTGVSHDESHS